MLLLGLLLLCATGAFTGLLIADNLSGGPDHAVVLFGNTIATMNSLETFLSGIALALIFCLALAMMGVGGRIRRRAVVRGSRASATATEGEATSVPADATGRAGRSHRHLFGH